jgi:hypothetical protein
MPHLRTSKLTTALLICGALMALALSSLVQAAQPGTETFVGECQMSGIVRHQPPLTQAPKPTSVHGSFSGTCSGQFTDRNGNTRQIDGAPAGYEARGGGDLSCLGGVATGTGSLTFSGGAEVQFRFTERRPAPGVAVVTLEGVAGGTATNFGTVSPSEDLSEINERCAGSGLRAVHGDARIVSPGISG